MADIDVAVDIAFLGPDEEGADQVTGGGSGCEVFVDVLLSTGRGGALVRFIKPDKEFDGFGISCLAT
jgi:hypothetical protein